MMPQPVIAIIGTGKMGHAVAEVAGQSGMRIAALIGRDVRITPESLNGADVAVDFTEPDAAVDNVRACVLAGCPVVLGTTGWNARLDEITTFVHEKDGAFLWAANFSLGVHALTVLLRDAGRLFAHLPGFDAHITETHHARKKDAPSGTALMLQRAVQQNLRRPAPITSIRVGSVPGTHQLVFDGEYEQVVISHETRDRRVFAQGALVAARWLVGRHGVFTLDDVLNSEETES